MGATIISPSEHDNVISPVPIEFDYNFGVQTNVTRHVAMDQDAGTLLNGTGRDIGFVATTATGLQRVAIKNGGIELSSQDNVNIMGAGPIPIDIDMAAMEVDAQRSVVVRVKGTCQGSGVPAFPFVACVIYSINVNGVRTAVTAGFDLPRGKDKKYEVTLKYQKVANLVYIVRSFLVDFQNPFTIAGATTKVLG